MAAFGLLLRKSWVFRFQSTSLRPIYAYIDLLPAPLPSSLLVAPELMQRLGQVSRSLHAIAWSDVFSIHRHIEVDGSHALLLMVPGQSGEVSHLQRHSRVRDKADLLRF